MNRDDIAFHRASSLPSSTASHNHVDVHTMPARPSILTETISSGERFRFQRQSKCHTAMVRSACFMSMAQLMDPCEGGIQRHREHSQQAALKPHHMSLVLMTQSSSLLQCLNGGVAEMQE